MAHIGMSLLLFTLLRLIRVLLVDSGKTTLTESILHASEYVASPGSVDSGSTTTDFLPAERERGITIQSASIPVHWKHWTFNLIDTPGHADFGMEVESASRVVDGVVVLLDGVEGVEAQTKGVWSQLNRWAPSTISQNDLMFIAQTQGTYAPPVRQQIRQGWSFSSGIPLVGPIKPASPKTCPPQSPGRLL
jgi:small GTP-binding protein